MSYANPAFGRGICSMIVQERAALSHSLCALVCLSFHWYSHIFAGKPGPCWHAITSARGSVYEACQHCLQESNYLQQSLN